MNAQAPRQVAGGDPESDDITYLRNLLRPYDPALNSKLLHPAPATARKHRPLLFAAAAAVLTVCAILVPLALNGSHPDQPAITDVAGTQSPSDPTDPASTSVGQCGVLMPEPTTGDFTLNLDPPPDGDPTGWTLTFINRTTRTVIFTESPGFPAQVVDAKEVVVTQPASSIFAAMTSGGPVDAGSSITIPFRPDVRSCNSTPDSHQELPAGQYNLVGYLHIADGGTHSVITSNRIAVNVGANGAVAPADS